LLSNINNFFKHYYFLDKIINLQGDILGGPKVASIFSGTKVVRGTKGGHF
jgi:hypothetical protein